MSDEELLVVWVSVAATRRVVINERIGREHGARAAVHAQWRTVSDLRWRNLKSGGAAEADVLSMAIYELGLKHLGKNP